MSKRPRTPGAKVVCILEISILCMLIKSRLETVGNLGSEELSMQGRLQLNNIYDVKKLRDTYSSCNLYFNDVLSIVGFFIVTAEINKHYHVMSELRGFDIATNNMLISEFLWF